MEYQLELKQIVDFPRCRIYRNFIQTLLNDRSIRTTGGSFLFWYLVLCSYANYSNSNRRMEQFTYTLSPGEWICSISELQDWFRCRFQHQAISILKHLQEEGCITYSLLEKNRLVKFRITDWQNDNTALKYNYPCKKDTGFFFFPIGKAHKLIQAGKCSEMDILLDLWIHAVYNDPSVLCSDTGPVVYYRNNTGSPLTSFQTLGERWGHNESGLYSLILSSKLPSAKEFKHWVTSEVLPSIRKNGAYIRNQENMTPAEIVARGLIAAQKIIEERLDHSTQPLFILTYSH